MSKIFVTSDTWFNRPLTDEQNVNVVDNNEYIISNWNSIVKKNDKVYVLGGFGVADLYHIVVRLRGEIHFLDNYFVDDEREFMNDLKTSIQKSNDELLINRIIFEDRQVISLNEQDCILSYFPLKDWCGKSTGTFCFHGLTDEFNMMEHNISCISSKWDYTPVEIKGVQDNIQTFQDIV